MRYLLTLPFLVLSLSLNAQFAEPCSEIPPLNKELLNVLRPYIGKQIDRGECWDAAKLALNKIDARWDGLYVFGRIVDSKKECIQPGDIVQFENAEFRYTTEDGFYFESFPHHTAIVYEVNGPGNLQLLHQNTGQSGRKMGITSLDITYLKKGKVTIYRPVPKAG